jgi:hypothetical protein
MKTFSSSYIGLKNRLEGNNVWAFLVELTVNANTTAFFTTHPETITHNNSVYMPIPMVVGGFEQASDGELPQTSIDVTNFRGLAYRFAKDNDLTLHPVTIKLVNTTLTNSGDWEAVNLQILGTIFSGEIARFTLGWNFNYDAMGPRGVWNRRDFPSIPFNWRRFASL